MQNTILFTSSLLALLIGAAIGWWLRARKSETELRELEDEWQEELDEIEAQRERLDEQNGTLIGKATEATAMFRTAESEREALRNKISTLESSLERIQSEAGKRDSASETSLRTIRKLTEEIRKWEQRVPPVIEKFRERDREAKRLARRLEEAEERIRLYETQPSFDETRFDSARPGDIAGFEQPSNSPLLHVVSNDPGPQALSLTAIRGIGPAIDRSLREHGIVSLEDLVQLSDDRIEIISEDVKGFASRYSDWAAQAIRLLEAANSP